MSGRLAGLPTAYMYSTGNSKVNMAPRCIALGVAWFVAVTVGAKGVFSAPSVDVSSSSAFGSGSGSGSALKTDDEAHPEDDPSKPLEARLLIAAGAGRFDDVLALIGAGAPIKANGEHGIAAIYLAAQNGHHEIVQVLIEAGASVEQMRVTDNTTPLMRAAYNGHPIVVGLLTAAGAELEKRDTNGYTAFQTAMYRQHQNVVDILANKGCTTDDPWPGSDEAISADKKKNRKAKLEAKRKQKGKGV